MAIYLYTSLKSEHEISWGGEEGGPYYSLLSVSQWVNPPAAYASPADADLFLLSDLWLNSLTLKRWKLDFTSPKHLCCEWVPSCFPCQRQQHDQINYHFHNHNIQIIIFVPRHARPHPPYPVVRHKPRRDPSYTSQIRLPQVNSWMVNVM